MALEIPAGADFFSWRNENFPFFSKKICLTHASVSPLPQRSVQALADYAALIATDGQFDAINDPIYDRCKERLCTLLGHGAKVEEIAFAGSTSHALGLVATSIQWNPGDNCVVADGDFPANVVTWKNLSLTHGVDVRFIPARPAMNITVEDVAEMVNEKTRLVSLSAINFLSGYPLDLKAIGEWLHARGILFCVDGIQALGAAPVDISEVDFVCADAHKWMLGPNGIALLWIRSSVLPTLRPMVLGWLSTTQREDWYQYGTVPRANADCFEPGARNYLGVVAMEASLALLHEAGPTFIHQRCTQLRDFAAKKLQEVGCQLLWNPDSQLQSGIVSFQKPGVEATRLYRHLDKRFALSLRQDKPGAYWIRVSPHFMNCEQDIEELAREVDQFGRA